MFRVIVEPIGKEVWCRTDQTVLEACLRAGIWLPHSCTHGTCGTCKASILKGEIEHGEASLFALMDFERDEGAALLCCAKPQSDLTIEADLEEEDGSERHPVRDYVAEVVAIEDCATDIRRVLLRPDVPLRFNPGQHLQLEVPGTNRTRPYSMANPPGEPSLIELHIRRTPGGHATDNWVFTSLTIDDEVRFSGPYGTFFYREPRAEPALLIAGGTGLAPIKSMVRHVLETGLDRNLVLYHGARTVDTSYDVDYFRELSRRDPDRFTYRPCLSDDVRPGFGHGRVTSVLDADLDTARDHVAYVCGPPPMVETALKVLMRKRLFLRNIYHESFLDERDRNTGIRVRSPLLKR